MTVDQAVVEQMFREVGPAHDTGTATARIYIWLAVERREGAVEALRKAAEKATRRGVRLWLNALADHVAEGGQL